MRILGTQPLVTVEHARHHANKAVLSEHNLPVSLIYLWGDRDMAGDCS